MKADKLQSLLQFVLDYVGYSCVLVLLLGVVCLIIVDAVKAFNKRAHWIPAKALVLSALTIQVFNFLTSSNFSFSDEPDPESLVYILNTQMLIDGGRLCTCVFMGYLLPAMATPSSAKDLRTIAALVVTLFAAITSELYIVIKTINRLNNGLWEEVPTGRSALFWYLLSQNIFFISSIFLVLALCCTVIAGKTVSGILAGRISVILLAAREQEFRDSTTVAGISTDGDLEFERVADGRSAKRSWNDFEDEVFKSWLMARASQPDYVMARSVLSSATGFVVSICILIFCVKIVWMTQHSLYQGLQYEFTFSPTKISLLLSEQSHALLLQLLFWFKQSFSWVNQPPCSVCGFETTGIGMGNATTDELRFGANRVELYRCIKCPGITRFPRYNDPLKLVETRRGRCGEWANCFTLYCRALGYQARLVLDFTDHVWTECFSNHLGRWMHLDPCESAFDNPLLYEEGWSKKLTYVIALAKDGVCDVTKRYTRKWHEVLSRRLITSEANVQVVVSSLTKEARRHFSPLEHASLENRDKQELLEIERSKYNSEELSSSLPGRQSGAKEWRIARAELGADNDMPFKSHPCPIRTCIDDHVGKVYKSFGLILHQCIHDTKSISRVMDEMKALQMFISKLKAAPFRSRKVIVDFKCNSLDISELIQSNSYLQLLQALGLKSCSDQTGKIFVCLAQEPVKTSLALPVAYEILEEMVEAADLTHSATVKLFTNCRRICCGSVQASGEQFPLGIATSAFDGLPSTKWEEPDGAKGSWIIHKLPNGSMQQLAAYQFTSANDAQERDPMDWVLEGSSDGGKTWDILDEKKSQLFEKRFLRKTFSIAPERQMCNAFRFRFLSVQNPSATTRLQIACIDLYAKEDKASTKNCL